MKNVINYLNTDERDYRGGQMKRVGLQSERLDNSELVSALVSLALKQGIASKILDTGVAYVVADKFDENEFESVLKSFKKPIVHFLKSDEYFSFHYPYFPITLVIKEPKALAAFLCAELFIFVFVDLAVLEETVRAKGATIEFLKSDECRAANIIYPDLGKMHISNRFFDRIFYEFLDPKWFGGMLAQSATKQAITNYMSRGMDTGV